MSRDKGTIRGKNSKPSVIVDIYVWIYRDKEKRFLTSADHRPHWNRSTRRVPSRRVEYFFHESRNDIYIYLFLSVYFSFCISSRHTRTVSSTVSSFQFDVVSVCIAHRSFVKNIFETTKRKESSSLGACLAGNNT